MSDVAPPSARLASVAPLFRDEGFELSRSWSTFDLGKLTKDQIATLHKRLGRWIRVYPSDRAALEAFLKANPPAPVAPNDNTNTTKPATKAGDTKAAKAAGKEG